MRQGIFPKIPTPEEIARLVRQGIEGPLREMWFAGAGTGLLAGLCVGLAIVVVVLLRRER